MQWCKKLQYMILNNKKFDWLKKDKEWQLDKVDAIFWIIFISMFLLALFLKNLFAYLFLFVVYVAGILGHIRHIKSVPADIESKLMSHMICVGVIFSQDR